MPTPLWEGQQPRGIEPSRVHLLAEHDVRVAPVHNPQREPRPEHCPQPGRDRLRVRPARSHPKVLAQTSAAIGGVAWVAMRRQDLVNGILAAVDMSGQRALVFSSDPERQLTIPDTAILQVTKVASGLNVIVDVLYGDLWSQANMLCFVGPRPHEDNLRYCRTSNLIDGAAVGATRTASSVPTILSHMDAVDLIANAPEISV